MKMNKFKDLVFNPHPGGLGGIQAIIKFANGYGCSVIQTPHSYGGSEGLYELALLRNGLLCYDSGITEDVMGQLNEADVSYLMIDIQKLED